MCKTVYNINLSTGKAYISKNNSGTFKCYDCDSKILMAKIAGEYIPYCPKCEKPRRENEPTNFMISKQRYTSSA
jgi:Zn finger protein HypA/HybF involved in hydrogenase expression